MDIDIEKHDFLIMKSRKRETEEEIKQQNQKYIWTLGEKFENIRRGHHQTSGNEWENKALQQIYHQRINTWAVSFVKGPEAKLGIIFQTFFFLVWFVQLKKHDESKFSLLALSFKHFYIKYSTQYELARKETTKNLWFA